MFGPKVCSNLKVSKLPLHPARCMPILVSVISVKKKKLISISAGDARWGLNQLLQGSTERLVLTRNLVFIVYFIYIFKSFLFVAIFNTEIRILLAIIFDFCSCFIFNTSLMFSLFKMFVLKTSIFGSMN